MLEGIIQSTQYTAYAFAIVKAFIMGAEQTVKIIHSYGFYSHAPKNSFLQVFCDKTKDNLIGIADDINNRPKNLYNNEYDIVIYNTLTKSYIRLDAEFKNIELNSTNQINLNAVNNINITTQSACTITTQSNCEITTQADCNITASGNNLVTAPNILLNGSVVLGSGGVGSGQNVARVGDSIQVVIPTGSSAGTYTGTITSGALNAKAV